MRAAPAWAASSSQGCGDVSRIGKQPIDVPDGVDIDISVQTICCHGDTPGAQHIVRAVREALEKAGCTVKPLRDFLPKA